MVINVGVIKCAFLLEQTVLAGTSLTSLEYDNFFCLDHHNIQHQLEKFSLLKVYHVNSLTLTLLE